MIDYTTYEVTELNKKLIDLNKKIAFATRTHSQVALPQLKTHRQLIIQELQARIERKKNDMYNKFWPTDSKIIGED
jgi:hypothetical protein